MYSKQVAAFLLTPLIFARFTRAGLDPDDFDRASTNQGSTVWVPEGKLNTKRPALTQRDPQFYAGVVVMGSRASYRVNKGLAQFAKRGRRVFFFTGSSESPARKFDAWGA